MSFIHDDFLLQSNAAQELYHSYAKEQPIVDYHCHLPPEDVAQNRRFKNLYDIWLAGDHYKWRAMRANGVSEDLCTGNASDFDKYMAWARTVPNTLRNPLYHWSHLELKRYFGIDKLLNEETAHEIWDEANEKLQSPEFSAHGILERFKVSAVCTTDDPADSLDSHKAIAELGIGTGVYPTFRPDKALAVMIPPVFNEWVDKLKGISGVDCSSFIGFKDALRSRHDFFHSMGGRLSDHGLERCFAYPCAEEEADAIYNQVRNGQPANDEQREKFVSYLMLFFAQLDYEKGWTKQLHLGCMRNNNSRLLREKGRDIGCDSIGDFAQGIPLARYLDQLDFEGCLPKMVLYNLNPNDNYLFATMAGNFQDSSVASKIQFGSGWWFLDQKEAMEWQINALSNLGLLSHFVGMLTDSRSFLSYCRHEYFRRVFCNMLGEDMTKGELPNDMELVGDLVEKVCYRNASTFFGLQL